MIEVRDNLVSNGIVKHIEINEKGLKLHELKKAHGVENALKILIVAVTKFNSAFNVANKMNATQIQIFAYDLLDTGIIDGYTLEDYLVFFELAKAGKYGTPHHFIDGAWINSKLEEYHKERQEAINREKERVEHNIKVGIYENAEEKENIVSNEKFSAFVRDFENKVNANKESSKKDPKKVSDEFKKGWELAQKILNEQ